MEVDRSIDWSEQLDYLNEWLYEHANTGRGYKEIKTWLRQQRPITDLLLIDVLTDFLHLMKRRDMDFDAIAAEEPQLLDSIEFYGHATQAKIRTVLTDQALVDAVQDAKSPSHLASIAANKLGAPSAKAVKRRLRKAPLSKP